MRRMRWGLASFFGLSISSWLTVAHAEQTDAYEEQTEEPFANPGSRTEVYDEQEKDRPLSEPGPKPDSPSDDKLSVGGLAAPEPMPEPSDQRSDIEKELDDAERQDAGRGLEFVWAEAQLGYEWIHPTALADQDLLDESPSSQSSFAFGGALGVRLLYFSLGARFRFAPGPRFTLWTLGGEVALRVPYGALEPYAIVGLGFAHFTGAETQEGNRVSSIAGLNLRLGGGIDYYLSQSFSLGAQVSFDYLSLHRGPDRALCGDSGDCVFANKGSAAGVMLNPSLIVGLHF